MYKKSILLLLFLFIIPVYGIANSQCPSACLNYKQYIQKIQSERAIVYNALNLTVEQLKLREDMAKENACLYDKLFKNLMIESYKLKALKNACANEYEIFRQTKVVKNIKKDINNLIKKENKIFEKSLTGEQKAKFSMIKKLERKEFKKTCHQKNYYKSNPKMRPFGNPET